MLTNDELKKKIIAVLGDSVYKWFFVQSTTIGNNYGELSPKQKFCINFDKLADALIAAGLTFDDEWKHRAEVAKANYNCTKDIYIEKIKQLNKTYDTVKLERRNGEPYEIVCTHCGQNIRYYVSTACMYCGAKLIKTQKETKDKFTDILQLKAFCDKQGIKCILTRRNEYVKCQDGYKIQFLNGDVIQGTDTYSYLEFDGTSKDIDNKRISLKEAKAFVAKNKNWLSMQAEKELAEERKDES